ncbi:MAG: hypothetical protein E6G54_09095 [Actinobacteria bacterium]|nr:MAG: hypothetical protein E6G54_09095 [Actinomycetota bacterium]
MLDSPSTDPQAASYEGVPRWANGGLSIYRHPQRGEPALHSFGESCYGGQMTRSPLEDAFAHHVWATTRLIDRCLALSPEQLETGVPGTYGTIIETMRHLVAGDSDYLSIMTGDRAHLVEADHMDLPELRVAMENHGVLWSELLAKDIDPDVMVHEVDEDDGYERDAAIGIRPRHRCLELRGASGSDHRDPPHDRTRQRFGPSHGRHMIDGRSANLG